VVAGTPPASSISWLMTDARRPLLAASPCHRAAARRQQSAHAGHSGEVCRRGN